MTDGFIGWAYVDCLVTVPVRVDADSVIDDECEPGELMVSVQQEAFRLLRQLLGTRGETWDILAGHEIDIDDFENPFYFEKDGEGGIDDD